jgi:hypothetical protein
MRTISRAAKALALTALPLALALSACSSSSGSSDSSNPANGKPAAAKDPNAGLLTGTQLKKALAPASFFKTGFAVQTSDARDTGSTYVEPSTAPASSKPDCTKLNGTSWIATTGVSGVSFAQNDYLDKTTSEDIAQEIDAFRGTTAATVMKDLAHLATTCATFPDDQTHSKVKVTGTTTPALGDAAYTLTLTDSAWQNGTTLVAARVGTNVVSVMSTDGHDNGAATAKKLTAQIVTSLKKQA